MGSKAWKTPPPLMNGERVDPLAGRERDQAILDGKPLPDAETSEGDAKAG